ncbi:hypothetical protein GCM10017783_11530 [Deinococcus piscis]|uniref:Outer membrane protein beta-barrel domain-containing protein n=1 Tax=Deinococcus piscis TaxID=394230 RepID=A0ABQ3K3T8_9DEIO|nr:hypothetical protein [Deinococcus piscis]GHG01025.1 hypothetical protein GCM10017783_11530 [Deinococcus piscis]
MKKMLTVMVLASLSVAGAQRGFQVGQTGVEVGLTGGVAGGSSAEGFVHVPAVAGPLGLKVSGRLSKISDAVNDEAVTQGLFDFAQAGYTEAGQHVVLGVDGTYRLGQLSPGADTTLYAGGRYGAFNATVTDGDNKTSTYATNAFGVGGGLQVAYPVASNLSVIGDVGVDQFFGGSITYTDSSGRSETSRPGDAAYSTQDDILNQPGTVFKAKVGVKLKL